MRPADMAWPPIWSTRQSELDAERLHAQQREATLRGELATALARVAELEATVAGLTARLDQLVEDRQFYYGLWVDSVGAKHD